jgi:hypothetical protein
MMFSGKHYKNIPNNFDIIKRDEDLNISEEKNNASNYPNKAESIPDFSIPRRDEADESSIIFLKIGNSLNERLLGSEMILVNGHHELENSFNF